MKKIDRIHAREILDSRGYPTLEVEMHSGDLIAWAGVPSGRSTGKFEAQELRDGGPRFDGMGVTKAAANVNGLITETFKRFPLGRQQEFDEMLRGMDGTGNFSALGANAVVGASIAYAKLSALAKGVYLCDYIAGLSGQGRRMPKLFMNVLNGGWHAGNNLAVQEFHIIPEANDVDEAIEVGTALYHALQRVVKGHYNATAIGLGEEGGFNPPAANTREALDLLKEAAKQSGFEDQVRMGLDVAASTFLAEGLYVIDGKKLSSEELLKHLAAIAKAYDLFAVEDPFAEDDKLPFAELKKLFGPSRHLIGDDLTATNPDRIHAAYSDDAVNGVIIKPNQIGTLTQAIEAANLARSYGWLVVASHRSGETEDAFIADFAVGIGADAVKFGAPARGERTAKYNQLMKIFS
ncbi:MAG: enolase C-terminal domain-like protein [bacterium]|nr:enolase C-terminal domain-like protein [bacterium]